MSGLPYYKSYPRDFFEGTVGWPAEMKGAYRLLLDLIYIQSGKLIDDSHYISGNLGMSVRKWNSVKKYLIEKDKIRLNHGIISNLRADKELEILSKYQDKQRENSSKSNKNNNLKDAMAMPPRVKPEPEPEYTPLSPPKGGQRKSRKLDFEEQAWNDFLNPKLDVKFEVSS